MDSILLNNNQISYINGDLFYNYIKGRPLDVYINLANNKLTTVSLLVLFAMHTLKIRSESQWHLMDINAECIFTFQLPIKEINRIYEEARQTSQLFYPTFNLADNPWNCDNCSFLPEFQVRLQLWGGEFFGREVDTALKCLMLIWVFKNFKD